MPYTCTKPYLSKAWNLINNLHLPVHSTTSQPSEFVFGEDRVGERDGERTELDPEKEEVFRFSSPWHVLNAVACFCNAAFMETEGAVREPG